MALNNGLASIGIATIICIFISYFLYKKHRDSKMIVFFIVFCFGVYTWIVDNFFSLPLTLSWWKEIALMPVTSWKEGINLIPFYGGYEIIRRFGLNEIYIKVLLDIYVYIALAPLLIGFSIKNAFRTLKRLHVFIISLIGALFPFLVYSAFVIFGKHMWKAADITYPLLFMLYFWIGYGIDKAIKRLW